MLYIENESFIYFPYVNNMDMSERTDLCWYKVMNFYHFPLSVIYARKHNSIPYCFHLQDLIDWTIFAFVLLSFWIWANLPKKNRISHC